MRWTFIIRQKIKLALLLSGIMALIFLTNMMERRNIDHMNKSFSSIYYDRLIPATDIFYLTEHLYGKRILMENFLYSDNTSSVSDIRAKLASHDCDLTSLIDKFSQTYLVETESAALKSFEAGLAHVNRMEEKILNAYTNQSRKQAILIYETEGKKSILRATDNLKDLTAIQSKVGLEMILSSKGVISNSNILMTLQIAITVIIGLLAQALIVASRQFDKNATHVHLN